MKSKPWWLGIADRVDIDSSRLSPEQVKKVTKQMGKSGMASLYAGGDALVFSRARTETKQDYTYLSLEQCQEAGEIVCKKLVTLPSFLLHMAEGNRIAPNGNEGTWRVLWGITTKAAILSQVPIYARQAINHDQPFEKTFSPNTGEKGFLRKTKALEPEVFPTIRAAFLDDLDFRPRLGTYHDTAIDKMLTFVTAVATNFENQGEI